MASNAALKKEIHEILKDADLNVISAKKVRLQLVEKMKCNLLSRKDEIDKIVMDFVNGGESEPEEQSNHNSDDEDEDDDELESSRTSAVPKREYEEDGEKKRTRKSTSSGARGTKRSRKKAAGSDTVDGKPKAKRSNNGFTRACLLSPELANLMGAEALPRHEVVKKMWSMIKERNLYDPKNKQYAICDDELLKVMGVKRFRTFGMLKYLKRHIKPNI